MRRPEVKGNDRLVVLGLPPLSAWAVFWMVLSGCHPLLQLIWNGRVSSFPSA